MKHCLILVLTECSITLIKNNYIYILFLTNTISVDYLDPLNFQCAHSKDCCVVIRSLIVATTKLTIQLYS
jgi:hypothetical protein